MDETHFGQADGKYTDEPFGVIKTTPFPNSTINNTLLYCYS